MLEDVCGGSMLRSKQPGEQATGLRLALQSRGLRVLNRRCVLDTLVCDREEHATFLEASWCARAAAGHSLPVCAQPRNASSWACTHPGAGPGSAWRQGCPRHAACPCRVWTMSQSTCRSLGRSGRLSRRPGRAPESAAGAARARAAANWAAMPAGQAPRGATPAASMTTGQASCCWLAPGTRPRCAAASGTAVPIAAWLIWLPAAEAASGCSPPPPLRPGCVAQDLTAGGGRQWLRGCGRQRRPAVGTNGRSVSADRPAAGAGAATARVLACLPVRGVV